MPSVQIRSNSQRGNAAPKSASRTMTVASKPKQSNPDVRPASSAPLNAQEQQRQVAQAAYFRAEKRGFAPGGELQDWIEAEAEIRSRTSGRQYPKG